jgi:multiple sugar transport system permease protein
VLDDFLPSWTFFSHFSSWNPFWFDELIRNNMHKFWHKHLNLIIPYSLLLPAFIIVFVLAVYTCLWLVNMSLVKWSFGAPWERAVGVGLANYSWLLSDSGSPLWKSLWVTAVYTTGTVVAELVFGFGIAILLNKKILGRTVYTSLLIIPLVMMPSMVGLIWRLYFSLDGLVNYFVELITLSKLNWYGAKLALPAVMIVDIWEFTPFFVLILLAGLQSLPQDPYEAAIVDGGNAFQIFRFITLPLMTPLLVTATILRLMDSLRLFDIIFVMFGGGPGSATTTLPILGYRLTMVARNTGRGSAASVMLIILISSITIILIRIFNKARQNG